jgi:7,8-dihydro-6-hydroxymethylpterin dimethyltransferase
MSAITAHVARVVSNCAWLISKLINDTFQEGSLPTPKWAPGSLLKARQRKPMATGIPRRTRSLCPDCNREAADAVVRGSAGIADFREKPGVIDAEIVEECGRILMRKTCAKHGPFEDVLCNHPDFFQRMEQLAFGADFECSGDHHVHNHGPNSIRAGRGTYLIVDLTNRCNMVCSPCFMDANGVGYVHELSIEDVKTIFNNALSFKPQREINVLFSGGEPTISPIFLEAVRHAKSMGFHRLHVATNGVRFAQSREFALEARNSGLHGVYLQLDGVSEEKNRHRGLGNYMEVKLRALENIAAAGMRASLQVTVVNGVNNDCLGDIVRFAIQNIDRIHGLILQPVMFTGRDESISTEDRYARRYPLSQIAYDLQEQTSFDWQPMRDWFPACTYAVFAHLCDVLNPSAEKGSLFTDTHPNRAVFSPLLVDTEKKTAVPLPALFNLEQFMRDVSEICDSGRGAFATRALVALSVLRNFEPGKAPIGFGFRQFRALLEDCFYRVSGSGDHWSENAYSYRGRWRILCSSPVWFEDAYNYDLSTVSNSSTPVATQQGELSFGAYNGGGWRKIVEHLHRTAALAEWNRTHGRHEIYANGKRVDFRQAAERAGAQLVQLESEHLPVPIGVSESRD